MTELLIFLLTGLGVILPVAAVYHLYQRNEQNSRLQRVPVRIDEEYPRRR